MKRAVWVSLVTYASTLLDTNLSSHDVDALGTEEIHRRLVEFIENLGKTAELLQV